jgi:N-acetylglucosamine kinase-like BadF-type ATPase
VAGAAACCEEAARAAINAAARIVPGLSRGDIAGWGFGLAGVRRETDAAPMREALTSLSNGAPFVLDTDAVAAHAGAFGGGAGVTLVAGTGTICVARDETTKTFYTDGWGPLLGDEGGGYWIGLEALKAVCRAQDGRGPRTALVAPILTTLGARDADDLVLKIYRNGYPRESLAKLSRVVFDAASSGVGTAAKIRDEAVDHLAISVQACARALLSRRQERALAGHSVPPIELPVALCGGLFEDDLFRASVGYRAGERLIQLQRDFLPLSNWRITRPHFDAATGAALLARQHVMSG